MTIPTSPQAAAVSIPKGVALLAVMAGLVGLTLAGGRAPSGHPEPRPGVTGAHVLHQASLPPTTARVAAAYAAAERVPQLVDGLRCYCACSVTLGHRSILSCFEDRHGSQCQVCQDEALIADSVSQAGGRLDDARGAVESRFGPPT